MGSLLGVRAIDVLKVMIKAGDQPKSSEAAMSKDLAILVAKELGFEPVENIAVSDLVPRVFQSDMSKYPRKPPVVTVIGRIL